MDAATFRARRERLAQRLPDTLVAVVASGPDADLRYLCGVAEVEAALVMDPQGRAVLYLADRDPEEARWIGPRPAHDAVGAAAGVDEVRGRDRLRDDLVEQLTEASSLGWRLGRDRDTDTWLADVLADVRRARRRRDGRVPAIVDLAAAIGELRVVKDDAEVAAIRRAAAATATAHRATVASVAAGRSELAIAADVQAALIGAGADGLAFETIVASGMRAVTLHATPSSARLADGELLLVDAGGTCDGYAADMSRTYAVGGADHARGEALARAVERAHAAALAEARPGSTLGRVNEAACEVLREACDELGLPGELSRWFPHRIGHAVGLEVHDPLPGGYDAALRANMVITIEPGLYVPEDADDAPADLRGAGARFEDTVLVTGEGAEILTR